MSDEITVVLPYLDRRLAANETARGTTQGARAAHRARKNQWLDWGHKAALAATKPERRPYFPDGPVNVWVSMDRPKRGKVWDVAAVIEASKAVIDGMQGVVLANDRQISSWWVEFSHYTYDRGETRIRFTQPDGPTLRVPERDILRAVTAMANARRVLNRAVEAAIHPSWQETLREAANPLSAALDPLRDALPRRGGSGDDG